MRPQASPRTFPATCTCPTRAPATRCARSPARRARRATFATPRAPRRCAPPAPSAPRAPRRPRPATRARTRRPPAPSTPARACCAPRAPTARRAVPSPCFAPRARGATRRARQMRARARPAPPRRGGPAPWAAWRRTACCAQRAAFARAALRARGSAPAPASAARPASPRRQPPRWPPCGASPPLRARGPAAPRPTAWAQTRGSTAPTPSRLRPAGPTLWRTRRISSCAASRRAGAWHLGAAWRPPPLPPPTARAPLRCFTTPPRWCSTLSATQS